MGTADNEQSIRILSVLHQLTLEGGLAKNSEELVFRMLNRSIALCGYDRALFFESGTAKIKLKGISGQASVNKTSEKVESWNSFAQNIDNPEASRILGNEDFPESLKNDWETYSTLNNGTAVLWLPINAWGEQIGGLWLERWSGKQWTQQEQQLLNPLILSYGGAWERLHPKSRFMDIFKKLVRKKRSLTVALLAIVALLLIRLPLRVVAPCEVVADKPFVITAPLNGVVEEVKVDPGDRVAKGQILFEYDRRSAYEELNVAREQVQIIRSSLDRARMQAFVDPRARSEITILEHRLEQEQARFNLAQYNVSRLEVRAEEAGTVVLDDPEKWRGRPVSIGERVLSVVDPAQTKVRIWIPEDDNMDFDFKTPVRTLLNVIPESSLPGKLKFVGSEVITSPQRVASVLAEVQWTDSDPRVKIGLKGVSVLYGERVSLAYWLFRKPWASFNRFFGI